MRNECWHSVVVVVRDRICKRTGVVPHIHFDNFDHFDTIFTFGSLLGKKLLHKIANNERKIKERNIFITFIALTL